MESNLYRFLCLCCPLSKVNLLNVFLTHFNRRNCLHFFYTFVVVRVLAQNENGEDSGCILVTVTAPPSPPGKPVVIDIAGTTCVLRLGPGHFD